MPEKPKRRKNNRNKRKNKNNHIDSNITSADTNSAHDVSSDGQPKDAKGYNEVNDSGPKQQNLLTTSSEQQPLMVSENKINFKNCTGLSNELTNNGIIQTDIKCSVELLEKSVSEKFVNDSFSDSLSTYIVETPDQIINNKSKLSLGKKSKSVDDDDSPKIIDITDENVTNCENVNNVVTVENVLISDSEVDWEQTTDLKQNDLLNSQEHIKGSLSVTTIPLTIAHCEQTKSLSPEDELSLRRYLQTLNLATPSNINSLEIKTEIEQIINREIRQRLRKKGLAEDISIQRRGPPRILDVIDEEGSGESSIQSRRHSYLSEKKSDNEELEDDVFEDSKVPYKGHMIAIPTCNILRKITSPQLIPQQCVLVDAKIKEPEISEARGDWTVKTMEKMAGAEVVYLTDSSSSTSSLYDVSDDVDNEQESDTLVRMITPTIEVTDTENLLKKSFIHENEIIKNTSGHETELPKESILTSNECLTSISTPECNCDLNIDQKLHEINIFSTDDIKTNLFVKDISGSTNMQTLDRPLEEKHNDTEAGGNAYIPFSMEVNQRNVKDLKDYDLEMKVLKCELNDAINNLIKEVTDTENSHEISKVNFTRQDSSSSISSSQCTAIYNPTSSLSDICTDFKDDEYKINKDVKDSNELTFTSHVNDVLVHISSNCKLSQNQTSFSMKQPKKLRDLCVEKISSLPYGVKILEELANVSVRLQNMDVFDITTNKAHKQNYYENKSEEHHCLNSNPHSLLINKTSDFTTEQICVQEKHRTPVLTPPPIPPPPVQPRKSSLKKSEDENSRPDLPTVNKSSYVCLSPSQKMLMEQTSTVVTKQEESRVENLPKLSLDRKEDSDRSKETNDNSSIKSLKSQTGSRLLALICDSSVTNNINSSLSRHSNKYTDLTQKMETQISKSLDKDIVRIPTAKYSQQTFKPIPPPRPKKLKSSLYESDESSNFIGNDFHSLKSERKFFHYSTGNLNNEIENDISTIQNMHKYYNDLKHHNKKEKCPRRPSLPKDLCDQQMEYIRQKEKEVEAEIHRLERENINPLIKRTPRAPMISQKEINSEIRKEISNKPIPKGTLWNISSEKAERGKLSSIFSSSQEELLREKMYSEYINEMTEREKRKQHKVIKISNTPVANNHKAESKSTSALNVLDSKINNRIEKEFISRARERWNKLGIMDPDSENEIDSKTDIYREPKVIEHKIKVIQADEEKDVQKLPTHLQDFVKFTAFDKEKEPGSTGESEPKGEPAHVVILCAVMLLVLAIGRHVLRLLRNIRNH